MSGHDTTSPTPLDDQPSTLNYAALVLSPNPQAEASPPPWALARLKRVSTFLYG